MMDPENGRKRWRYAAALVGILALGLPTRLIPQYLPAFVVNYAGDALWAMAIFLGLGLLFPKRRTLTLFIVAMCISWGIEFSELYQADWINQLRSIKLFALVLGYTFLPVDLVSYTVGIVAGVAVERFLLMRFRNPSIIGVDET